MYFQNQNAFTCDKEILYSYRIVCKNAYVLFNRVSKKKFRRLEGCGIKGM